MNAQGAQRVQWDCRCIPVNSQGNHWDCLSLEIERKKERKMDQESSGIALVYVCVCRRPHVQAWLSWSERGTVNTLIVGSIPSKTSDLKFPWI